MGAAIEADGMTLPVNSGKGEQIDDTLNKYSEVAVLTQLQRVVLFAMLDDIVSENIRTMTRLAEELEIERKTIYNCTQNPKFKRAMSAISHDIVGLKIPQLIVNTLNLGQKEWRANKFLLEYAGAHVDKSITANIHTNISPQDTAKSPTEAIDTFFISLLSNGWSRQRIDERVALLESQGI